MNSTVLPGDTVSHISFSLSGFSTGLLLSVPLYIIPSTSYTLKRLKSLIDIVAVTGIILPLQDGRRRSGMNYHITEDYGYRRGLFTGVLSHHLLGYSSNIPYEGVYNLYCMPSLMNFLFQKRCNIKIKININIDELPTTITSVINFQ